MNPSDEIIVLTHNPKGEWGDVRPEIETNHGYKGWNKSFNFELGQCVIFYISSNIGRYEYIMKVAQIHNDTIDLELVNKIKSEDAELLTYKQLKEYGLKQGTVNYILSDNKNAKLYHYVTEILNNTLYRQCGISNQVASTYDKIISSLNKILYGPPGTGKTYHTIDKALQIIDGNVPESREEAKARFEVLKDAGQIEFVTFHQSYGYEEFVEGIKAKTVDVGIEYQIEAGIFKRLCEEALSKDEIDTTISSLNGDETIWKMSLGDSSNGKDKIYYEEAKNTDCIIMGYGNNIDFSNSNHKNDIANLTDDESTINAIDRFKNQLKNNDIVIISDGNRKFKAIVRIIGDYFFDNDSDLKQKRKIEWLQRFEKSRDVKEISDRNFTQVTLNKPQGIIKDKLLGFLTNKETVDNTKKNYLLIIDEINRGNISKIFGELITLIEESKRLGNDEAMEVTLPYSGEKFRVPKNLYIIGTMNTADRSIALMDTALRRRFEFEEMMPKPELLSSVGGIDLEKLLTTVNKRVEYLYDRDHTIGHAYFMGAEDKASLDSVMRNKVIPLLQEYFYDDWEKIQIVLGDHKEQGKEECDKFVRSAQNNEKDILGFNYDELDEEEYSYIINESFTDEAYLKIYE